MNKPQPTLLISVGVILIFVGGVYFLNKGDSTSFNAPPEVENEEKTDLVIDKSLALEKSYNESTSYAVFKVSFPQFKNASAEFNSQIENMVKEGIANHTRDSEQNWKARYETSSPDYEVSEFPQEGEKFNFDISWEPVQLNDKFISVLLTISGYTGGAHGYQNLISFNYDVVNQQELSLADLLPEDLNYLKTVSDFSRKELTAQFRKKLEIKTKADETGFQDGVMPMLLGGTSPDKMNFSVFTFTDSYITLYFTQYQVAPYSMGESRVVMPRK